MEPKERTWGHWSKTKREGKLEKTVPQCFSHWTWNADVRSWVERQNKTTSTL